MHKKLVKLINLNFYKLFYIHNPKAITNTDAFIIILERF